MPELPEVEVLVRHLAPSLCGKIIRHVGVRRAKVLGTTSEKILCMTLLGAKFLGVTRRGKFLLFVMRSNQRRETFRVTGHLGMTGRMYLQPANKPLPKHAAVVLGLGKSNFIFEDTRYFGRFTLDVRGLQKLGPEPFSTEFSRTYFYSSLKRSTQAIKVKLLDQSLVAGVGNIYASEALFRAGISPRTSARKLSLEKVEHLRRAIIQVLEEAIQLGSTLPLDWAGRGAGDGLFYYGRAKDAVNYSAERLLVYDRAGQPCSSCGTAIRRIVQAARSTFYCPQCQRGR